MGPTASGKTELAIRLCEQFPCDVISVDSALVYRGMDIGTAKPDAGTLARTPHRLIDIREPEASYSATPNSCAMPTAKWTRFWQLDASPCWWAAR